MPENEEPGHPAETVEPLQDNFAFVMNVRRLADADSYTLAPGHELRRAKPNEIAFIKNTIGRHAPAPHNLFQALWEQRLPQVDGPLTCQPVTSTRQPIALTVPPQLPEAEWRYFVISFKGGNATIVELERAFDLSSAELEVGFTALQEGLLWSPSRFFHVLQGAKFETSFFIDVSDTDIVEVRNIHSQFQQHDRTLVNVQGLTVQLSQLKALPHSSPLRFLGYFAILESLLTHAPEPKDPYDSITRQVKKKVALLNSRFARPIDYAPFGGALAETVWGRMYGYRSLVAHGGDPQFTGDLAVLKNHRLALTLIKETVKAVIRQALLEPKLLIDLKDC